MSLKAHALSDIAVIFCFFFTLKIQWEGKMFQDKKDVFLLENSSQELWMESNVLSLLRLFYLPKVITLGKKIG